MTNIQWTWEYGPDGLVLRRGETWNPTEGCTRVSSGCDSCYAFALHDMRYAAWKKGNWPTAPAQYHRPFSADWKDPATGKPQGVQLLRERLQDPLHWRTPRRVFVDSMSDLFEASVPDEYIAQVWAVMAQAHVHGHTFLILTKRPARMAALVGSPRFRLMVDHRITQLADECRMSRLSFACYRLVDWPLPNVHLGTSVEDQAAANERIPRLLNTPAAIRFLSCEPLLGPVDLLGEPGDGVYGPVWHRRAAQQRTDYGTGMEWDVDLQCGVDWLIIGGESGPRARPMSLAWARSLVRQCREANVAVFMKQLGSAWAREEKGRHPHGGDMEQWPEDLRVREYPATGA